MARSTLPRLLPSAVLTAVLIGVAPTMARAQGGTQAPVPHEQTVSANPFLLIVGWFNAEYERKLTPRTTWGLSVSYLDIDEFDYVNGAALVRFYPQGAALSGLFFGGRAGVHRVSDDDESGVAFGVGFELGYNWLLGADRNFDISIGAGATRLFGADLEGDSVTIPQIRLVNIGYAF